MSKNQISILGLLILSLGINVLQRMPASEAAQEPLPAVAATRAPLPELDPIRFRHNDTAGLVAAGLTESEARHLAAAYINSEFEHAKNRLRTIDDPWLTLDEIHAEATGRFRLIRAAEKARRDALEALTGQSWAETDLDYSWGKVDFILSISGITQGFSADEIRAMKALIIEGAREVSLIESTPFGRVTEAPQDDIADVIAAQEEKMRTLLGEEKFTDFFKLWVMMMVEDVWDMEDRFGRRLSDEESDTIAGLLMPEHPLAEIIGKSAVSSRNLPEEILPQVRELVGEEAFAHLLDFQAGS